MQKITLLIILISCVKSFSQSIITNANQLKLTNGENLVVYVCEEDTSEMMVSLITKKGDTLIEWQIFVLNDGIVVLEQIDLEDLRQQFWKLDSIGFVSKDTFIDNEGKIVNLRGITFVDKYAPVYSKYDIPGCHIYLQQEYKNNGMYYFKQKLGNVFDNELDYIYFNGFWIVSYQFDMRRGIDGIKKFWDLRLFNGSIVNNLRLR